MNLPNKLTLLRIIIVPIICFVWLFPYSQFNISIYFFNIFGVSLSMVNVIVLMLFIIASITDFFDGKIARENGIVTTFGKFADPIADKVLIDMMLIILSYKHMIPVLPVILMVIRDLVVDGCRMIASSKNVIVSAGILGKTKTVLQMCTIIIVLLNNLPFELINIPVSDIMIWFTSFVSIAGGYSYFSQLKEYIFESM